MKAPTHLLSLEGPYRTRAMKARLFGIYLGDSYPWTVLEQCSLQQSMSTEVEGNYMGKGPSQSTTAKLCAGP